MTNATFTTAPITHQVGAVVERNRFVVLAGGKLEHCTAAKKPYGHVGQAGAPAGVRAPGDVTAGRPDYLAVNCFPCVVDVDVATGAVFAVGDPVHTAADGKAAKSGGKIAGIALSTGKNGRVRVSLFHPAATAD